MALGDYLIIGIILFFLISGICVRKEKRMRYDLYLESLDGETTKIATNQQRGRFYVLDDILCYFDELSIKKYLRIESGDSLYAYEREAKDN